MTKVVSLIRLIRHEVEGGWQKFMVEYKLPEDDVWAVVGILHVKQSDYTWIPSVGNYEFIDIEVSARDLYSSFENRFNPIIFAKYKINKILHEIISGEWNSEIIIPPALAD